jgi:hypothetical protein
MKGEQKKNAAAWHIPTAPLRLATHPIRRWRASRSLNISCMWLHHQFFSILCAY